MDAHITSAYNMMHPAFRKVLLDKGYHKDKIERWQGTNYKSSFKIDKQIKKGDYTIGKDLVFLGIGTMTLSPAVYVGNNPEKKEMYFYYHAQIMMLPVTMDYPDGLLVKFISTKPFDDPRKLRAYLIENNIPLTDEADNFH